METTERIPAGRFRRRTWWFRQAQGIQAQAAQEVANSGCDSAMTSEAVTSETLTSEANNGIGSKSQAGGVGAAIPLRSEQRQSLSTRVAAFLAAAVALSMTDASSLNAQDTRLRLPTLYPVTRQDSPESGSLTQAASSKDIASQEAAQLPALENPQEAKSEGVPAESDPQVAGLNGVSDSQAEAVRDTDAEAMLPADGFAENFGTGHLSLADVIASVYQSYPEVNQAREEVNRTLGDAIAADGSYDLKLKGYSLSEPTGFYRNYRHGIGVARQTWWGGNVSAGYRIGRGEFQPWYKERETEKAGEFKIGLLQPLLQGRGLDANRVAVFQSRLAQQAADPYIQQTILDTANQASVAFWDWVAAGSKLEAQKDLLALALRRGEQYEAGVDAGQFAEIDLILNNQLIAERRIKAIEAEQKFAAAGFKLSLFLRDATCQPMVPDPNWTPNAFPQVERSFHLSADQEVFATLARRPEVQLLVLQIQRSQWDLRQAENQMLPGLDLVAEASQDLGTPASSSDDKGDFQLLFGVQGEVPIQRRKARGKRQSTEAKIAQLRQKLALQQDKVKTELQIQANALELATAIVEQAELGLQAAVETLDRYRFAFRRGKVDLIYLNLLETKATESELKWLDAQRNWFTTLAQLQRALALDPLQQANQISALSQQSTPTASNAPDELSDSDDAADAPDSVTPADESEAALKAFEEDWKRHEQPGSGN